MQFTDIQFITPTSSFHNGTQLLDWSGPVSPTGQPSFKWTTFSSSISNAPNAFIKNNVCTSSCAELNYYQSDAVANMYYGLMHVRVIISNGRTEGSRRHAWHFQPSGYSIPCSLHNCAHVLYRPALTQPTKHCRLVYEKPVLPQLQQRPG